MDTPTGKGLRLNASHWLLDGGRCINTDYGLVCYRSHNTIQNWHFDTPAFDACALFGSNVAYVNVTSNTFTNVDRWGTGASPASRRLRQPERSGRE